jgi:hypothetical protein
MTDVNCIYLRTQRRSSTWIVPESIIIGKVSFFFLMDSNLMLCDIQGQLGIISEQLQFFFSVIEYHEFLLYRLIEFVSNGTHQFYFKSRASKVAECFQILQGLRSFVAAFSEGPIQFSEAARWMNMRWDKNYALFPPLSLSKKLPIFRVLPIKEIDLSRVSSPVLTLLSTIH